MLNKNPLTNKQKSKLYKSFIFGLFLGLTLTLIVVAVKLNHTTALMNRYQKEVTMALSLYSDAQKTQNFISLGDNVQCFKQLTSADMIQIKVLR